MSAQHQPPTEGAQTSPLGSQTAAIGIEERITDLLDRHGPLDDDLCCRCGEHDTPWTKHVASVLVAELGLTQEWTFTWPDNPNEPYDEGFNNICDSYEDAAELAVGYPVISHYATRWEPA